MEPVFKAISGSARSLHVQVARKIARGILSGELPQNSILPGEMELCDKFGVSRTALREAIKLLTSKRLLESRPKIGTRVLEKTYWNFLDPQLIEWIDGIVETDKIRSQFLSLRLAVEPEACALAAKFATDEHRNSLTDIYKSLTEIFGSAKRNEEQWNVSALRFHCIIYTATENDFYVPFSNILTTMTVKFPNESLKRDNIDIEFYQNAHDAIMTKDSERARDASLKFLSKIK